MLNILSNFYPWLVNLKPNEQHHSMIVDSTPIRNQVCVQATIVNRYTWGPNSETCGVFPKNGVPKSNNNTDDHNHNNTTITAKTLLATVLRTNIKHQTTIILIVKIPQKN